MNTKTIKTAIISVWIFMIVSTIWMTGLTLFMFHELNDDSETVVIENEVCTSAPNVPTSIPVIEETIPTDETEAETTESVTEESTVTEPVTEPSKETEPKPTETPKETPKETEPKPTETEPATEPKPTETPKETEPATEPKPTEPDKKKEESTKKNNMSDLEMLACVIYQEAGSDSICDDCRRRVADVVLNRVADSRFPNSIYKVLTAKNQYGKFCKTGIVWPKCAKYAGEKHAVERAYRIAEEVLNGQHSDLYGKGYVWQAQFKQGTSGFWCCGTYFGKGPAH